MERPGEATGDEGREEQPADQSEAPTPDEFEQDPARNPDDERLEDIKGG